MKNEKYKRRGEILMSNINKSAITDHATIETTS